MTAREVEDEEHSIRYRTSHEVFGGGFPGGEFMALVSRGLGVEGCQHKVLYEESTQNMNVCKHSFTLLSCHTGILLWLPPWM